MRILSRVWENCKRMDKNGNVWQKEGKKAKIYVCERELYVIRMKRNGRTGSQRKANCMNWLNKQMTRYQIEKKRRWRVRQVLFILFQCLWQFARMNGSVNLISVRFHRFLFCCFFVPSFISFSHSVFWCVSRWLYLLSSLFCFHSHFIFTSISLSLSFCLFLPHIKNIILISCDCFSSSN